MKFSSKEGAEEMTQVTIFSGPNQADNAKARCALASAGFHVETVLVGYGLNGLVKLPFAETSNGTRYYGIQSIEAYSQKHRKKR